MKRAERAGKGLRIVFDTNAIGKAIPSKKNNPGPISGNGFRYLPWIDIVTIVLYTKLHKYINTATMKTALRLKKEENTQCPGQKY